MSSKEDELNIAISRLSNFDTDNRTFWLGINSTSRKEDARK